MTSSIRTAARLAFVVAALALAPVALAGSGRNDPPPRPTFVPEFDPAAGGAMVALLAGGALFIANRRQSKSK